MARFVESRRRWDKGDWGNLGSYRAGALEDGFFKATNMVVYDDGSIGPRTGPSALAHTGMPTGAIRCWGYVGTTVSAVEGIVIFVVGNTLYWAPAFTAGAVTSVNTLAGTETEFCSALPVLANGIVYFATRNQGVYKWDVSGSTVTQVLDQAGLHDLVRYRDRLYACNDEGRVFYSDAADFDTWVPATSFFDVGWTFPTFRMASLRNNLFFIRQGGGHYVASGVPESTLTLRETSPGLAPDEHSAVVMPAQDSVWWVPQNRNAPVKYRGGIADTKSAGHLEDWTGSGNGFRTAGYSFGDEATMFLGTIDNKALLHWNDVFTRHEFDIDAQLVTRAGSDWFLLAQPGDGSTAPTLYLWEYGTNQPGVSADTGAQPGDNSNTPLDATLDLPEWWHPQGHDVVVETLEVEFVSFDTDTAATAHFDVVVRSLRPQALEVTDGYTDSATYTFDEATASSAAGGTERRVVFGVGDQGWARGYQVRFTNVRNVAIRSVTVSVQGEARRSR